MPKGSEAVKDSRASATVSHACNSESAQGCFEECHWECAHYITAKNIKVWKEQLVAFFEGFGTSSGSLAGSLTHVHTFHLDRSCCRSSGDGKILCIQLCHT